MYTRDDDWDEHRWNPEVHYRLYVGRDGRPCVICVQDFDYFDYDARLVLSPEAWESEFEAEQELLRLLPVLTTAHESVAGLNTERLLGARLVARAVRALLSPQEDEF
jgi:hypothetical protein